MSQIMRSFSDLFSAERPQRDMSIQTVADLGAALKMRRRALNMARDVLQHPVGHAEPVHYGDMPGLLVERFDRLIEGTRVSRLTTYNFSLFLNDIGCRLYADDLMEQIHDLVVGVVEAIHLFQGPHFKTMGDMTADQIEHLLPIFGFLMLIPERDAYIPAGGGFTMPS